MNTQDIFNKAVGGILKQGESCFDSEEGQCMYRMGKLRCAAGFLINDECYGSFLEHEGGAGERRVIAAIERSLKIGLTDDQKQLICRIQSAHDNLAECSNFIDLFTQKCMQVASNFKLNWEF